MVDIDHGSVLEKKRKRSFPMFPAPSRKLANRLAMLACALAWPMWMPVSISGADKENDVVRRSPHYVGVQSCAASNCHGGDGSRQSWTSSYSTWVQKDRHAQAYSALFNPRSQRMVKLLGWATTAWESQVCLNCHSLPPQGSGHVVSNKNSQYLLLLGLEYQRGTK